MEILILSDTHGYLDDAILRHASEADEVWHAGDFGNLAVSEALAAQAPLRGVYGNIDGTPVRKIHPLRQSFEAEGVRVFMIHIGGYPGRYAAGVREQLVRHRAGLFVCGHSHIVKVMRDPALDNLVHINPGAAGKEGFHRVRTLVRLQVRAGKLSDVRVVELGPR